MTSARKEKARIGLVGARGHVGQELIAILRRHAGVEIAFVTSHTQPGARVPGLAISFEDLDAAGVAAKGADAVVLALPNDLSRPMVQAIDAVKADTVIVDVSADHRFDEAWVYGLPELFRAKIKGATRIANPGCYATAAALVVGPVASLLAHPAQAFGVSGYSGAGTTPSPRNDVAALQDNLMPYHLVGHVHEREVTHHVGPVCLMPHVAAFFRGISMTVSLDLRESLSREALRKVFEHAYGSEPMVKITSEIPLVRGAQTRPWATIGGFSVDEVRSRAVVVSTLDNLLKGAASQAVQNLNLALGFSEVEGILPWPR
ncbi:MAG: N-acetyl-gamma-glutamyl-phosphate reductase [Byssovorax sp.]